MRQTLRRPNIDGYEKDVEFSLKVRQMRAAENSAYQQMKQAQAAQDAVYAANRAANAAENRAFQEHMNNLIRPVPITFGPPSPWRSY